MNILCCYNVNIDAVGTIDGAKLTDYIRDTWGCEIDCTHTPDRVSDMTDLILLLLSHIQNGTGGEYLLEAPDAIVESSLLIKNEPVLRLGGNAGIAASVLSNLGASLVIPNVASMSRTQADLLTGAAIRIPVYENDELALLTPHDAYNAHDAARSAHAMSDCEDAIHYVFDFKKGTEVKLRGRTIVAPDNNRVIATYDPKNIALHIDCAFEAFSNAKIKEMDGALVSGLHLLRSNYPDGSTYLDHLQPIIAELRSWKSSNPDLKIHFESGDFLDAEIRDHVISYISSVVDSIGMNEDEFFEGETDFSAVKIIEKAVQFIGRLGISRLCTHTRDFMVSVFDRDYIDCASEIDALGAGAAAAAARAATGRVDRASVDAAVRDLEPSSKGARECAIVHEHFGGKMIGNGVNLQLSGYSICVVPSLWCEHPVSTVGMGDTMTAGAFLVELAHRR